MLSYQHHYHAGNFADVFKHFTLSRLLHYLTQKEKPLFYLESHAGRGAYDLDAEQALKNDEASHGIQKVWRQQKDLPALFTPYLQAIHQLNSGDTLRFYPGSPALAIAMLRKQDRLFCCELHPEEFRHLQRLPRHHQRVFFSHSDGLHSISALVPPPERRGLIFIDPSYEVKAEYHTIPAMINKAFGRFATGVYCLWYPIIHNQYLAQLTRGLQNIGATNHLRVELFLNTATVGAMHSCGLWIINPPHTLAAELKEGLEILCDILQPGIATYHFI